MANGFFGSITKMFGSKDVKQEVEENLKRVNVSIMKARFDAGDLVGAAVILRNLLEIYGEKKKKNHRQKGREFIYFILSHKHKDLKNIGYTHWQNINKIIHLNQTQVYPYHKQNLEKAMAFFTAEIKGINAIDVEIKE
jgi:hypothetical protein